MNLLSTDRIRARRRESRGYRAWVIGKLDEASELLEAALRLDPRSLGARLHLARVRSEQGRPEEALALLEDPGAGGAGVLAVFRSLVVYDHQDAPTVRAALAAVPGQNIIVRAIEALTELGEVVRTLPAAACAEGAERFTTTVRFPLAARHVGEVAGRALAILEGAFARMRPAEWPGFHHAWLVETPDPSSESPVDQRSPRGAPDAPSETAPPAMPRATFASREQWIELLESALATRRYPLVEELARRKDVGPDWFTTRLTCIRAYALAVEGKEARALDLLGRLERDSPLVHFILGLCRVRLGALREAGWSFARAARLADIEIDAVLQAVSGRLGIRWAYEDA